MPFLVNFDKMVHGTSTVYYLSIVHEKSKEKFGVYEVPDHLEPRPKTGVKKNGLQTICL